MKIEIKNVPLAQPKLTFPCLMISKTHDLVIMALGLNEEEYPTICLKGIVLQRGNNGTWTPGTYCSIFGRQYFEPFHGTVTMSNE